MCVFPGEMCWNKMFLVLTGILTRIGFSRMLSRSHGCSGSGWPLWTTLSGSKVPFFMALMRRFLLTLRRNLPKVWACSLPRKVRLSCLENMVVADSSRRWDFNARAAAPTASTPVAAHEVHAVPRDEARGIWGSPCFTTGDCDREFGRASIVRKDLWRLWRPHTATAASKRPQRKESRCILPAAIMAQSGATKWAALFFKCWICNLPALTLSINPCTQASCSARETKLYKALQANTRDVKSTFMMYDAIRSIFRYINAWYWTQYYMCNRVPTRQ